MTSQTLVSGDTPEQTSIKVNLLLHALKKPSAGITAYVTLITAPHLEAVVHVTGDDLGTVNVAVQQVPVPNATVPGTCITAPHLEAVVLATGDDLGTVNVAVQQVPNAAVPGTCITAPHLEAVVHATGDDLGPVHVEVCTQHLVPVTHQARSRIAASAHHV